MNYEQFAIWLHGFLEISNAETIDKQQTQIIKDHLALLFEKKTPDRSKKKEEKTDLQILQEKIKEIEEKNRGKSDPPPYAPVPMPQQPAYPHWQWVPPEPVYCKDTTASPLPYLGTTVSKANPCQEIPIGELFPSDIDPHKTINDSKEAFKNFHEDRKIRC